jgi:hypothetical protein
LANKRAAAFGVAGKLVLWEYGSMKTTFDIPDPLFKRVKARAAMEGRKLKHWVTSALRAYLSQPKTNGKGRSCPFPLVRGKGGPLLKQMSNQILD